MTRNFICATLLLVGAFRFAAAQSLDDLNIQIHGYATQGLLYTTQNNMFTADTSDGSPAWTEAVVNVSAQPMPKLRIGVQGRYFLLGNYGGYLSLDWAAADYKFNDRLGVRFGKVKTPTGLFNEVQDIDPSYMWALLPQSVYPIGSRNSLLAHYGVVGYGASKLGPAGKVEYYGWTGEQSIEKDDGLFVDQTEEGVELPNGATGFILGTALHWHTPVRGWMVGASDDRVVPARTQVTAENGLLSGTSKGTTGNQVSLFTRYERQKLMLAAESYRYPLSDTTVLTGIPPQYVAFDRRGRYAMATYKFTDKLTAGLYDSQYSDRKLPPGPGRYQKDWALSARYDFTQFLYLKAEEHFLDGTVIGYDVDLNPNGIQPDTRLTILKVGVSF